MTTKVHVKSRFSIVYLFDKKNRFLKTADQWRSRIVFIIAVKMDVHQTLAFCDLATVASEIRA